MNEVRETLERAIASPLEITFGDADEARLWVFRAHNHIRRHFPQGKQLMISRRRERVTLRVPTMTVRQLCIECGINTADLPSLVCPGCKEHTNVS